DALTITERGTWIAVARCALSLRMVVAKSLLVAGDSYPNADWLAKPVLNFVVILKFDALAFQVKMFSRAAVHQYRTVINHMAGNLHLSVQKFVSRNYEPRNRSINVSECSRGNERQHGGELSQMHIALEGRYNRADRKQSPTNDPNSSRTIKVS